MQIDPVSLQEGFLETFALYKQGEAVTDFGVSHLPTHNTQQKWRFAKHNDAIHLSDGQRVYSFKTPLGLAEGHDTDLFRDHAQATPFGKDAIKTGFAQVHRSDPGSIYFTMQEGSSNPTFTFRHVSGDKWKAIPKKKAAKKTFADFKEAHPELLSAGAKAELAKHAGINWHNVDVNAGRALANIPRMGFNTLTGLSHINPAISGLGGLALGTAWDQLQRKYYNTEEENQQESAVKRLLRIGGPAALLAGGSAFFNNLYNGKMPHKDLSSMLPMTA